MFALLVVVFLVVPMAEIYLFLQVNSAIGLLDTFALLILISVVGAWLVRREGLGVMQRVQRQLAGGELPTNELVDGLLILTAGLLMLTPGFLTDGIGMLFLLPPTRVAVRTLLIRRFRDRVQVVGGAPRGPSADGVWDVSEVRDLGDVDHSPVDPDELES